MPNTSNEPLALLWAYELNRQNKCLFKGLRKAHHRLSKLEPLEISQHVHPDLGQQAAKNETTSAKSSAHLKRHGDGSKI